MKMGVMPRTMTAMGTPKRHRRSSTNLRGPLRSTLPGWKYPAMRKKRPMKKASLTLKNNPIHWLFSGD